MHQPGIDYREERSIIKQHHQPVPAPVMVTADVWLKVLFCLTGCQPCAVFTAWQGVRMLETHAGYRAAIDRYPVHHYMH